MRKYIAFSVIAFLTTIVFVADAPTAEGFNPSTSMYVFPITAKVSGAAGTDWRTEACIANGFLNPLTIRSFLIQDNSVLASYILTIPAMTGGCIGDIYAEVGLNSGSGVLLVKADPADNPGAPRLDFAATVKIYNQTAGGTYAQEITPVLWDFEIGQHGVALAIPGIQHYGTVGSYGLRTNIGVFNLNDSSRTVTLHLFNENGQHVGEKNLTIPGYAVRQTALPNTVRIRGGAVTIETSPGLVMYGSIVDNRTGDPVFRPHVSFVPLKSNYVPGHVGSPDRSGQLERGFLRGLRELATGKPSIELELQ